jgi:sugar transferase EpsL
MNTKRAFDLGLVLISSPIWIPVFLLTSLAVFVVAGAPVFFRQERPGLNGKCFTIIKFRTMRNIHDANGVLVGDELRLTGFGRWLRATSLDELPELVNVIRGEMSLVGPRPLLVKYLTLYSDFQRRRHDVPPGITGWAQVNGRNAVPWERRFELDVWYVEHANPWLDTKILCKTLVRAALRKDITAPGSPSMPEFGGNDGGQLGA